MLLEVTRRPGSNPHHGLLRAGGFELSCILGKTGITCFKREGDGATPSGAFRLLYGYFRDDRLAVPRTSLPMVRIDQDDGWCDAAFHARYNQPVKLPFSASHEQMMRNDHLYDICIVLDYNIHPQIKGRGSAIFFHLTRPNFGPTEGCIAIERDVMLRLLPHLTTTATMLIKP